MSQVLNGLAYGSLLLILSSGLVLIFGLRDIINFAHGGLYMVGAYLAYTVTSIANFWVALLAVPIVLAGIGVLVDRGGLRFLKDRDHMVPLLALFGLALVIEDLVIVIWGRQTLSVRPPAVLDGPISVFGTNYPIYRLFLIAVAAVLAAILIIWLARSSLGLYLRAASVDKETTAIMGVNVDRASLTIVAIGFGLAGLAGVLAAPYQSIDPGMGATIVIITFIVVVLGGLGSVKGAMAAAMLVGMTESVGVAFFPRAAIFVPYIAVLLLLLFRPSGLAGARA